MIALLEAKHNMNEEKFDLKKKVLLILVDVIVYYFIVYYFIFDMTVDHNGHIYGSIFDLLFQPL